MPRRAGGRQARHALRSAPLSEETKPVRAGIEGGSYRPLSDSNIAAIDENIFRILEEIGFKDATPHCIETCVAAGAILGDDDRLRMPRDVVEMPLTKPSVTSFFMAKTLEMIKKLAGREFILLQLEQQ